MTPRLSHSYSSWSISAPDIQKLSIEWFTTISQSRRRLWSLLCRARVWQMTLRLQVEGPREAHLSMNTSMLRRFLDLRQVSQGAAKEVEMVWLHPRPLKSVSPKGPILRFKSQLKRIISQLRQRISGSRDWMRDKHLPWSSKPQKELEAKPSQPKLWDE